ncbi:MAG TPA: hypothetical protein VHQ03_10850 [Candidatus Dormibacteraeota bacterium]|jgi:hypothetical protein|nr:hypothetical protein [Candidatus Dormibacteraeota bacterium]
MKDNTKLLLFGLGVFLIGAIGIWVGWTMDQQHAHGDVPSFSGWLIDTFGKLVSLSFGSDTQGQRVGSAGIFLAAVGLGLGAALISATRELEPRRRGWFNWFLRQ